MNLEELGNLFILYGLNIIYALGLLTIGWWIATFAEKLTSRALLGTHRVDPTIISFLASLVRYAILVFVGVAVLQRFGIQTTSIIAVLGATSLAIGLALQGTLSNLAAGVMLLLFRPFRIDDLVEVGGQAGTVKDVSLFTTELVGANNVQILMPNSRIWGAPIINKSAYFSKSFTIPFLVKPGTDVNGVKEEGLNILKADSRVANEPSPAAAIAKNPHGAMEIIFSGRASSTDIGPVREELAERLDGWVRDAGTRAQDRATIDAALAQT